MSIEADIEAPAESPIFSKYPAIMKDKHMTEFICDYLRIMSSGNMAPHELEALFDVEISSLTEELQGPSHAVTRVSDALPGFGIVAAVLGIVITMGILGDADNADGEATAKVWLNGKVLGEFEPEPEAPAKKKPVVKKKPAKKPAKKKSYF